VKTRFAPLSIFQHPYRQLLPLDDQVTWRGRGTEYRGTALIWNLAHGSNAVGLDVVESRPGGVMLMAILPPAARIEEIPNVWEIVERCRPHTIVPHHPSLDLRETASLLSRPPEDLPADVVDYMLWRGVDINRETRHLLRRTIELSEELTTITALARSLYLSRRALGRRMKREGLPVPSHWLQFSRVLRASIRLQTTTDNLFRTAYALGYPDGFTLSNQMKRLIGIRPSEAKMHLGWEWIVEAWLRREQQADRFRRPLRTLEPTMPLTSSQGLIEN